jgi:hypothetical protein
MVGPDVDAAVTANETPTLCVAVDETPLIVNANVPVALVAVVATVRVELPPAMTDAGANVPVAPAGRPATDRLTVWAAPEVTCVPTVYVVLEPWTTVWLEGLALMAKSSSGAAVTVKLTVVKWVVEVETYWPVTVSVNVPSAAPAVVAMVRVEPCPAVTDAGLKVALVPEGSPLADRLTVRGIPEIAWVLTAYVVLEPTTTV